MSLPTSLRGSTAMMTDSEIKQTDEEEHVDKIDDHLEHQPFSPRDLIVSLPLAP